MADGPAEILLKSAQSWLIISSLMLGGKGGFFAGVVKILRCGAPVAQREGVLFLGVTPRLGGSCPEAVGSLWALLKCLFPFPNVLGRAFFMEHKSLVIYCVTANGD